MVQQNAKGVSRKSKKKPIKIAKGYQVNLRFTTKKTMQAKKKSLVEKI